jgi:hypothetical protein
MDAFVFNISLLHCILNICALYLCAFLQAAAHAAAAAAEASSAGAPGRGAESEGMGATPAASRAPIVIDGIVFNPDVDDGNEDLMSRPDPSFTFMSHDKANNSLLEEVLEVGIIT